MAKPRAPAPRGTWTTWPSEPSASELEVHIRHFFDAIRANQPIAAFALCPHASSKTPYLQTPDRDSISAAFKLIRVVLVDNNHVPIDDKAWFSRLSVSTVKVDTPNAFAKIAIDAKPTSATGLFKLVHTDDKGWQLCFTMVRILVPDPFAN